MDLAGAFDLAGVSTVRSWLNQLLVTCLPRSFERTWGGHRQDGV